MGQRHQVFVIARLVPHGSTTGQAFYRCIAAHHHQFCYGSLPLRGVNRFLALLRNENNASIIRDEIRRVQGVYGRRGESPYMPLMPCPYTLFLLSLAWNVDMGDLEQPYFSGAGFDSCVFSPNMGSFAGDNDDGITVIDVTDPADPAYCFIRSRRSGPVDMRGYVRHYYNLDAIMKKREGGGDAEDDDTTKRTPLESAVVEVVAALEGVRLVTLGMLAEVWPHEYKPHYNEAITDNAERQAEANPIPSLVELSIAPAVEHSLSTDDTSELEGIVWQPGKAELVKKALMARNPFPDNGISLLVKLLEHDLESTNPFILDLSFYPSLSPEQVLRVVTTLSKTFLDIKSLNLTGNHNISTSTVAEVLKALSPLLRLILLDTSITDDDLLELMSTSPALFYHLHDLIHPAFLRSTSIKLSRDYDETGRFPLETLHPAYRHGLTAVFEYKNISSVPFFNLEKLLRSLAGQLSVLTCPGNKDSFLLNSSYNMCGFGPGLALSAGTTIVAEDQKDGTGDEAGAGVDGQADTTSHQTKTKAKVVVNGGDDWYSRTVSSVPRRHSLDCFKGVGWIFMLDIPQFNSESGSTKYAFAKPDEELLEKYMKEREKKEEEKDTEKENAASGSSQNPRPIIQTDSFVVLRVPPDPTDYGYLQASAYKLHGVREFVKEVVEKEGRPPPSEEAIVAFESAIQGNIDLASQLLEEANKLLETLRAKGVQEAGPEDVDALSQVLERIKVVGLMKEEGFKKMKETSERMFSAWTRGYLDAIGEYE